MPRTNRAVTARVLAALLTAALAGVAKGAPMTTAALPAPYLSRQAPAEFRAGKAVGVTTDPAIRLAPNAPVSGGVTTGTLESAVLSAAAPFTELLPSWNAVTPAGTWVTLEVRADLGGRWTRYYSFGTWSSTDASGVPRRASLDGQNDADAKVLTDVVRFARPATRYQYRVRLSSRAPGVTPEVRLVTLTTTARAARTPAALPERSAWGRVLDVPARSQMVFAEGEGWCSPTSVSMVLTYLGRPVTVPEAARGTFDAQYGGTGNWAFNAAYAASLGFTAYATRLSGLADVERHILAGVPVVMSLGWGAGELPGAPLPKSAGHLIVIVGFDAKGNVVVNDPAGRTDADVRRVYDRAILERLWLGHSGGTVYVIRKG